MVTPAGATAHPWDAPMGAPGSLGVPLADPPRDLHVVLQHRGGVGGTLVAALLAQYYQARGVPVLGFDLAPAAPGFARYQALDVRRVAWHNARGRWSFDKSVEELGEAVYRAPAPAGAARLAAIADLGPAGFREFFDCCAEGVVGPALSATGIGLVLHTVAATDGAVAPEAAAYYARAAELRADTRAVVWLNDGRGGPERGDGDVSDTRAMGRAAGALVAALAARYRVAGVVHVPTLPPLPVVGRASASGRGAPEALTDARPHALTEGGRTFAEVLRSDRLDRATRRALGAVRDDVFGQIARALDAP